MDKAVVRVLKEYKASLTAAGTKSELVFPGWDGTLFKPTMLDRKVKELRQRADWPGITIHKFRHSCTSVALEYDENGLATSRMLGHASVKTTFSQYGHLFKGR